MASTSPEPASAVVAVVLCGGTSARLGGGDKTARDLGAATVLDTLLMGLPDEWGVVCVGEARPTTRGVTWTREDPPLGGPLAGVAAGLAHVTVPTVVVLAGDQPFAADAARVVATALHDAAPETDGVLATQADGRGQPLLAAYRTHALRAVIPTDPSGHGVHRTVAPLRLAQVDVTPTSTLDVDTPADLAQARRLHDDGDAPGVGRREGPGARGCAACTTREATDGHPTAGVTPRGSRTRNRTTGTEREPPG